MWRSRSSETIGQTVTRWIIYYKCWFGGLHCSACVENEGYLNFFYPRDISEKIFLYYFIKCGYLGFLMPEQPLRLFKQYHLALPLYYSTLAQLCLRKRWTAQIFNTRYRIYHLPVNIIFLSWLNQSVWSVTKATHTLAKPFYTFHTEDKNAKDGTSKRCTLYDSISVT